jgi:hypothetical protein
MSRIGCAWQTHDAYPPIEELSGRERVRLEALREPEPRHGLRLRVKRCWRSLRVWLFTPLGRLVGFASFVVAAAGLFAAVTGGGGRAPARMAGDLNVAVERVERSFHRDPYPAPRTDEHRAQRGCTTSA